MVQAEVDGGDDGEGEKPDEEAHQGHGHVVFEPVVKGEDRWSFVETISLTVARLKLSLPNWTQI